METSAIGPVSAFLAGMVSFLSPCVLPLVPGYVSYIAGQTLPMGDDRRGLGAEGVGLALCFVLGFSTVFVSLGAGAAALGGLLATYRQGATLAAGVLVTFFGIAMLAGPRIAWLQRDLRFQAGFRGGRPLAAFGLGLAFGFGWTPCIGPVLGAILTLAAVSDSTRGAALLAVYSAGLGVPFLVTAAFTGRVLRHQAKLRRWSQPLYIVAGVVMLVMGVAMVTGHLTVFSLWLLKMLPILGRIG